MLKRLLPENIFVGQLQAEDPAQQIVETTRDHDTTVYR